MNTQDSWSCLTVQQFLHFCNWEGQKEAKEHFTLSPSLLSHTSLPCLTVQQFLYFCNWEGQKEVEEMGRLEAGTKSARVTFCPSAPLPNSQTSWQCLSVKEFFSLCNWHSSPPENRNWHHLDPYSRLKQQVTQFFQFINWEGDPEIGKLPKSTAILPLPIVDDELAFTDLADLF